MRLLARLSVMAVLFVAALPGCSDQERQTTRMPDAGTPDSSQPNPDAAGPVDRRLDAGSDIPSSDTGASDIPSPYEAGPTNPRFDGGPGLPSPDSGGPDAAKPDTTTPDTAGPGHSDANGPVPLYTIDAEALETGKQRLDSDLPSAIDARVSDASPAMADLVISPATVDLGVVEVGGYSEAFVITVTNTGFVASGPLTVTVSGDLTFVGCSDTTLAPQASCLIGLISSPTTVGPINGTLEVGDSPAHTTRIAISGFCTTRGGALSLTPSPLDLGGALAGTTVMGTIVVTNKAVTDLTGLIVDVRGVGFSRSPSGTCADTLPAGLSCNLDVSFTAGLTFGPAKGRVIVSDAALTRVAAVDVSAKALAPSRLTITPTRATFLTAAGTPSPRVTFWVTNEGDITSAIPVVSLEGPNQDDFTLTTQCGSKGLLGGQSCATTVVYAPKAVTSTAGVQAILTVAESGQSGTSASAFLAGTAEAPSSGGSCSTVTACGGDVVGTWDVRSSCLKTTGRADIRYLGFDCTTALIEGTLAVSGTLTLGLDGKYTDQTVTTGSDIWELDRACKVLSGTRVSCASLGEIIGASRLANGYEEFTCADAAINEGCHCQGKVNLPSGMGLLDEDVQTTAKYKVAANTLTLGYAPAYSYCVQGTEMIVSPTPDLSTTPYFGTVVLQKRGG